MSPIKGDFIVLSVMRAMALAASASIMFGCNPSIREDARVSDAGTVTVYTVNYPLKYFADRIGGEQVDVVFPAPVDEDPAFWTPNVETVSAYQQADIIFLNGATYAKWVPKVTLPDLKIVNTTRAVEDKYISVQDAVTHSHGPGGEHSHERIAFTTWLDPEIAIAQATAIRDALAELRPEHKILFHKNLESLKVELEALDLQLKAAVNQKTAAQPILFSRPVYQYLERRYGLSNAKSLQWEPNSVPTDNEWAELRALLKGHPAKWMIWESAPHDECAKRLLELGVNCIVFDPGGNTPNDSDWMGVMNRNANELARINADSEQ